jgi:hypothetical protein
MSTQSRSRHSSPEVVAVVLHKVGKGLEMLVCPTSPSSAPGKSRGKPAFELPHRTLRGTDGLSAACALVQDLLGRETEPVQQATLGQPGTPGMTHVVIFALPGRTVRLPHPERCAFRPWEERNGLPSEQFRTAQLVHNLIGR